MSTIPLLTVESLCFERDDCNIFNPIDLLVEASDILQIEGPNGAGKTTLIRLLTGVLTPTSGAILYAGRNINRCRYDYLADILYIGHQTGIKMALSAQENLRWISPVSTSQLAIEQALNAVGLRGYSDIPCYSLSAGQHRRVALAQLFTSRAALWYLDEPFTAIDKQGVACLQDRMQDHLQQGGAIILSTHQDLSINNVRKYRLEPHSDRGRH